MKKFLLTSLVLTVASLCNVIAQDQKYDVDGRYIVIENLDSFFDVKDDCIESVEFYIRNFPEAASSKPVHVAVNDLSNVVKFGIASSSEQFYEQRRCYIRLSKTNHEQAFYNALIAMGVVAVVVDGEVLSLSEFLSLMKS